MGLTYEQAWSRCLALAVASRLAGAPEDVVRLGRRNVERRRCASASRREERWLDAWSDLLDSPVDAIIGVLTGDDETSRELRATAPFAGALNPRERQRLHREFRRAHSRIPRES